MAASNILHVWKFFNKMHTLEEVVKRAPSFLTHELLCLDLLMLSLIVKIFLTGF